MSYKNNGYFFDDADKYGLDRVGECRKRPLPSMGEMSYRISDLLPKLQLAVIVFAVIVLLCDSALKYVLNTPFQI